MSLNLDYIAAPVPVEVLKSELSKERFVRITNKGDNEIYVINHHNSPNVMQEIGRLREVTFASAGGGTGNAVDIDENDTSEHCYQQLVLWAPEAEEIIGGYRFIDCSTVLKTNPLELSTAHYFHFSDEFVKDYLPYTIELGRSWVQPNFQPGNGSRKGIFALDNLWDGLGAITIDYPHIRHFFGKVTMYSNFDRQGRDAILAFMNHFFADHKHMVVPKRPLEIQTQISAFVDEIKSLDFKEAHRVLTKFVRDRNENIPPLINNYMQLSPTMKCFGTALNPDFGDVEETGILVTINDIYPEKKKRHVDTYLKS
ncbi:MAG: GNAT family N-acetyltransferase [Flavobacteriales bacterium]|nr:GNAT family N-acetyltransferase [Flavobacteriales bacterium]